MLIGPLCTNMLTIELVGNITSKPYIEMTANMMQHFGIPTIFNQSTITVKQPTANLNLQPATFSIEPDWSAASYWFLLAALSQEATIKLDALSINSIQGDSIIAEWMTTFGVETTAYADGMVIRKSRQAKVSGSPLLGQKIKTLNLVNCPDLAPTLAVCAAATQTPLHLKGLQNLVIKESNRLAAIETELTQLGYNVTATADALLINGLLENTLPSTIHPISTYLDHRMAMAFAPLSMVLENITIENPDVVEKSYPHFWKDLKQVGFEAIPSII
jgi:3-phosphoshikimate 1-carboxyvinyltransferase